MNRKHFVIATLISVALLTVVFIPLSNQQEDRYDPWIDYNDDGTVNADDLYTFGQAYGSSGNPTKNVNVTNFPLDEQGNLRVNINNISTPISEQTARKIAIYKIGPHAVGSSSYAKAGELVVPAGEKWYVYKMSFKLAADWMNQKLRVAINGTVMMDDIHTSSILEGIDPWWEIELRTPLEVLQGETIELWHAYTSSGTSANAALIVEAWVEST